MASAEELVLEVAFPDCAAEDMGDEIVALNVASGVYFSMRELAVPLWRDLANGFPVPLLADLVAEKSGNASAVGQFANQLVSHGLMRRAGARHLPDRPSVVGALDAGASELVLEIFEDMKDLILSDPIHDVDQAVGWPAPARSSSN